MSVTERRLRVLTLVLAGVCLVLLFGLAADQGPGASSPATWWLLAAASACQLGASVSSRRRVPVARYRIQAAVYTVVTAAFIAIALGRSGV